jgi:DNA-binding Lrp family transcriptional regulator
MNEERKTELKLKEIELRIIAELMKNSRRSDRELAKAMHTSQPTVSRTIKRLEKEGIIKEYTMIPDFAKLGYKIMGITQMKVKDESEKNMEAEFTAVKTMEKERAFANFMAVIGTDASKNRAFITFYKNYSAYSEGIRAAKKLPFYEGEEIESFLVDLESGRHYRLISMSEIARHILQESKNATNEGAEP